MQTESLTLKSTPAAKIFMRLIAAFNTGDIAKIGEFVAANYDTDVLAENGVKTIVDWYMNMFEETGGFNIHKVYMSQESYLIVIVKTKNDDQMFMDKLKITETNPHKVLEYLHEPA